MKKVIMISTDRKVFEKGSAVRERIKEYGTLFAELHVIVYTLKGRRYQKEVVDNLVHLHPTESQSRLSYLFDGAKIGKNIAKGNDWVVTAQDPFEAGLCGLLIKWGNKAAKLQIQLHTDMFSPYFRKERPLNWVRLLIAKLVFPNADCIRTVSERLTKNVKKVVRKNVPISTLPIVFQRDETTDFDVKKAYPEFEKHIVMLTRLEQEKNTKLGIYAMKRVLEKHPKVGLIIGGEGSDKKKLERLAKKEGVKDSVCFAGHIPPEKALASADIFLATSNYEGYGMALVEAGLSDKMIVTTNVGIAEELFSDVEGVFICKPKGRKCIEKGIIAAIEKGKGNGTIQRKTEEHVLNQDVYFQKFKELIEHC